MFLKLTSGVLGVGGVGVAYVVRTTFNTTAYSVLPKKSPIKFDNVSVQIHDLQTSNKSSE